MKHKALIFICFAVFCSICMASYQNVFIEYLSNYSGKSCIHADISVMFNIKQVPRSITADLYMINSKYIVYELKEPEIFSGIFYVYDIYNGTFYTKNNEEVDAYEEISIITASIPNILNSILIAFQPDKFNFYEKIEDNFLNFYFEPKSKNFLQLFARVDYVKFKAKFFSPYKGVYVFDSFYVLNSDDTKNIKISINKIDYPDEAQASKILESYFSKSLSKSESK